MEPRRCQALGVGAGEARPAGESTDGGAGAGQRGRSGARQTLGHVHPSATPPSGTPSTPNGVEVCLPQLLVPALISLTE